MGRERASSEELTGQLPSVFNIPPNKEGVLPVINHKIDTEGIPERIIDDSVGGEGIKTKKTKIKLIDIARELVNIEALLEQAKTPEQLFSLAFRAFEQLHAKGGELIGSTSALKDKLATLETAYNNKGEHLVYLLGRVKSLVEEEIAGEIRSDKKKLETKAEHGEKWDKNRILNVLAQAVNSGDVTSVDFDRVKAAMEIAGRDDEFSGVADNISTKAISEEVLVAKVQAIKVVERLLDNLEQESMHLKDIPAYRELLDLRMDRMSIIEQIALINDQEELSGLVDRYEVVAGEIEELEEKVWVQEESGRMHPPKETVKVIKLKRPIRTIDEEDRAAV